MITLPINENSCIIQPYFDGGESYTGHKKYTLVSRYRANPNGSIKQTWEAMAVNVAAKSKTVIETDGLNIDISDFTRFRLFIRVSKSVGIKLYCNDELVLDECGRDKIEPIDSNIITTQKIVNSLRYEFDNKSNVDVEASLFYLGMLNDKPKNKNPYTSEWEGFFEENPSLDIYNESLISRKELEALRERIKTEPYKSMYLQAKEQAEEAMTKEPEKNIGKTVSNYFRELNNISKLIELAIVGQIDGNYEMLRMACRGALSLACCEYWCCDPMETVPMVTWHHRSFTESEIASWVSIVIALAGNILTWHGRNFLYNMIIMKALPRMEADFMTMEYIYHMNQGIAFMTGYVQALTVLADNYPRYKRRVDEAEELLDEMLKNAFSDDGNSFEGAGYWQYTMISYLRSVFILSRYRKKSLKEYVGNKLDKISDFGLSLVDESGHMIPVNDGHPHVYVSVISALMYNITDDKRWLKLFKIGKEVYANMSLFMLNSIELPDCKEDIQLVKEFSYSPDVGYTQICRNGIHMFANSGPSNSTHCHYDKGSFIVYKNGRAVIPDVTAESYADANSGRLQYTQSHTLAIPEIDGKIIQQLIGNGIESVVKTASYENGTFEWSCDNKGVWEPSLVKENTRTIVSDKAEEFIITDEFEFAKEANISFRINISDKNAVKAETVNWTPIKEEWIELYKHDNETVYQLILTSKADISHKLITKLTVK